MIFFNFKSIFFILRMLPIRATVMLSTIEPKVKPKLMAYSIELGGLELD